MEDGIRHHRIRPVGGCPDDFAKVQRANESSDALGVKLGHRRVSRIIHQTSPYMI